MKAASIIKSNNYENYTYYTKTDLVFGFTRPRQNEYRAGERLTGRAGWKPKLGEGIPGQKAPRTFPGQKPGAEDFTRSILSRILSENHYEMSIIKFVSYYRTISIFQHIFLCICLTTDVAAHKILTFIE